MQRGQIDSTLEALTPKQRAVLRAFLAGKADDAIATQFHVDPSTVRRHLANICKQFGLQNAAGERYSYRDDLLDLFTRYRPDLINTQPSSASTVEPAFPGGPLDAKSAFYVQRPPTESRCIAELQKPGALVRLRAPQYFGKTSLILHVLRQVQSKEDQACVGVQTCAGMQTVAINLRQVNERHFSDANRFLQWFCRYLSRKLNLSAPLEDYWDDQLGSLVSCTDYVQVALLEQLKTPLVLVLDEVDVLLSFPVTARQFFALLRSWHEEAKNLAVWQKLRLCVSHSTEIYIQLDLHQSPFNVGLPLRLVPFTLPQSISLAQTYGRFNALSEGNNEVQRLHQLLGGYPYLMQLALYHLCCHQLPLTDLLENAPTQAGIYSHHLRHLWQTVHQKPPLVEAVKAVVTAPAGTVLEPILAYQLESLGLIQLQGNRAVMSCDLYQAYFQDLLIL